MKEYNAIGMNDCDLPEFSTKGLNNIKKIVQKAVNGSFWVNSYGDVHFYVRRYNNNNTNIVKVWPVY